MEEEAQQDSNNPHPGAAAMDVKESIFGGNQTLGEEQVREMEGEERRLDSGVKQEPSDAGIKGGVETTATATEVKEEVMEEGTKVEKSEAREFEDVEMAEGETEQDSKHNLPSIEKIDPSINNKSTENPEKSQLEQEMELPEAAEPLKNIPPASAKPRKKRARKTAVKTQVNKEEDDVCFVCFDGGDLVLCDQRNCPKAYHLQCIEKDPNFYMKKGPWHCVWHFCCGPDCSKKAGIRCYTCPRAYCASCRKHQSFLQLGKSRGLCHECASLVKMIEQQQSINEDGSNIDFDDKETYECLFKEYWEDLKIKESIPALKFDKDGKLVNAKESSAAASSGESDSEAVSSSDSETPAEVPVDEVAGEPPLGTIEAADDEDVPYGLGARKERKTKVLNALTDEFKCTINQEQKEDHFTDMDVKEKGQDEEPEDEEEQEEQEEEEEDEGQAYQPKDMDGWVSKELMRIIKSMNGNTEKPMKRLAVHRLLLDYIRVHDLQSPHNKSIVRCDDKLQALFGKKRVSRRSIMKYMQYHLCYNSKAVKKAQTQAPPEEAEDIDDKRLKLKRKIGAPMTDSQEYAAINPTNIGLVYLRRALLEDMLGGPQFEQKICGTYVRIRVPGMVSRNEMCYRLVQIVGTRVQDTEYKAGKKMTNIVLQIMNLHKREDLTIDLVSNQDFTEDECKRLRQSIRCGFIKAPTVGEFQQKAISIREAKMNDWFETETARLTALRDRANEKGKKKELRECVEKLQRLADPDYRSRELKKVPALEADPSMDPDYESSEDEAAAAQPPEAPPSTEKRGTMEPPFKRERRTEHPPYVKQDSFGSHPMYAEHDGRTNGRQHSAPPKPFPEQKAPQPQPMQQSQRPAALNLQPPPPPSLEMFEREKAWNYQDPTGTVQGPFSFEQLRKWSTTGLFPPELKIWKSGQSREQGVLLIDALSRQVVFPPQPQAYPAPQYPPSDVTPVAGGQQKSPWSREQRDSPWDNNNNNNQQHNNNNNNNVSNLPSDGYRNTNPPPSDGYRNTNPPPSDGYRNSNPPNEGYRSSRLQQLKKSTPCRFYQRGYCRNGDACQFQH